MTKKVLRPGRAVKAVCSAGCIGCGICEKTCPTDAIRVQGIEKAYKQQQVLRGVDLAVERGSVFALLGSNGAGKTTLVKILATLLKADGGSAAVNGFDVAAEGARVRESISLTGQFAAVDELLSGRENLVLVARLRRIPDAGRVADELLERFALTDAGGRKVSTYSGGMRRRLDIAMSLINDPPVLFLDEPTTGLDPEARLEVWRAVERLAEHGTTVLLTTQYLDEAEQLADRIAILHEGRILVNGTLAELKALLPAATAVGELLCERFAAGGVLYTIGAVVYALRKPNPWPRVFGFHEVFHTFVTAAALAHLVAVAGWLVA